MKKINLPNYFKNTRPPSIILSVITVSLMMDTVREFNQAYPNSDELILGSLLSVAMLVLTIFLWVKKNEGDTG